MKKFLHTSIIQGSATSCEEQLACRELDEQELVHVIGGTGQHGRPDRDDEHHHDRDERHHGRDEWHHGRDDWHHDWDDRRKRYHR